jgi:hypothetical protein
VYISVHQKETLQVLFPFVAELLLPVAGDNGHVPVGTVRPQVSVPYPMPFRVWRGVYKQLQQAFSAPEKEEVGNGVPEMEGRSIDGGNIPWLLRVPGFSRFIAFPGVPGKAVLLPQETGNGIQKGFLAGGGQEKEEGQGGQLAHNLAVLVAGKLEKGFGKSYHRKKNSVVSHAFCVFLPIFD